MQAPVVRKPAKLLRPAIVMAVGAEGASLALLTAEVGAWQRTNRSLFSFKKGQAKVGPGVKERVFWVEQDELTVDSVFDKAGPSSEYFTKTDFKKTFEETLHECLDPHQWWLLQPIQVHTEWESAIRSELDRHFPGWEKDPTRYAKKWKFGEAWQRRFALSKVP